MPLTNDLGREGRELILNPDADEQHDLQHGNGRIPNGLSDLYSRGRIYLCGTGRMGSWVTFAGERGEQGSALLKGSENGGSNRNITLRFDYESCQPPK